MRESAVKVFDPPLLYRWTFNDEQSILKDWTDASSGVNTYIKFQNGQGVFNGAVKLTSNKFSIKT